MYETHFTEIIRQQIEKIRIWVSFLIVFFFYYYYYFLSSVLFGWTKKNIQFHLDAFAKNILNLKIPSCEFRFVQNFGRNRNGMNNDEKATKNNLNTKSTETHL